MKAKDFFQPEQSRPLWAKLTDKILAENAVRKYKDRVGVNNLIHPILQTWHIHLNSAQLPDSQKRMMRVAYKHKLQLIPVEITPEMKRAMPFWYHCSVKGNIRPIYSDEWGTCHREVHNIKTVGDMLNHTNRSNTHRHTNRINCACSNCHEDRRAGCSNPTKCRRNTHSKLDYLTPAWDPRTEMPRTAHAQPNDNQQGSNHTQENEPSEFQKAKGIKNHSNDPREELRIFTAWDDHTGGVATYHALQMPIAHNELPRDQQETETIVYTDGSCTGNGTLNAKAGSGIWYGPDDPRNTAIKLAGKGHTNNSGELTAVLVAIQQNQNAQPLKI
ncbi:hypothetical protein FA13DRAFT_1637210 [Coprinellus micaceus]|uniref:ribonuclease H n=1 Tax=Coprinellus micaceus TaxID=71717 RepID=A0A4Y7SVC2_COPMI|nr:hypothetical protein FA13DRAFT_1637210 [Coprinellus micaceus]